MASLLGQEEDSGANAFANGDREECLSRQNDEHVVEAVDSEKTDEGKYQAFKILLKNLKI